ncbi:aldehyde dehydrogenase family protein [Streptomyces rapamycinicus]|uniref:Aldehyde dehydrogenase (NAD+) n=1 Tax=Streptomyces rapamycinicus TaxID=1226757 RepID=A0ABR6M1X0_9ACTN|nr:aldehyde dehydrogenase family protein [Streptomyces rapamycinicus]MBB4788576.1 aldehyde dehydrogenase (NAD+) [Streptomyces rapamycinicus]UTP35844.1 aldehyde dehydrogenase family protein [Streptomyces rapamycinicus NRRL 5491]
MLGSTEVREKTLKEFLNYIGGERRPSRSGAWLDSVDPSTGQVWARIPASTAGDVDDAVRAAQHAFDSGDWTDLPAAERAARLRAWADAIETNAEWLSEVETRDNGRPLRETRFAQLPGAAMQVRYIAGLAENIQGSTVDVRPGAFAYTRWEPVGVTALIIPWNGPLPVFFAKVAASLAAGNAIVVKPAQQATVSILEATRLFDELDIPPGLVNVVSGRGSKVGDAVTGHPGIGKISFTGSTETGRRVMERATVNIKNLLLELGGKSPNIVFADADLDAAVAGVSAGVFTPNAGQACVAGSRVLIEASVYDDFVERLAAHARSIAVGDPMDLATGMGPLATESQYDTVRSYLRLGQEEGARLAVGGRTTQDLIKEGSPLRGGFYAEPSLFTTEDNGLRISQEEIFGPVAVALPFDGEDQAVTLANNTPYGLAAGVWTEDVRRAHRMANRLRAGNVWVNTYKAMHWAMPFGGQKQSGNGGTANGATALHEWMDLKSVWMNVE